jgi:hypothetical protein
MNLSYKDAEVLGFSVDTETEPKTPAWAKYTRILFDMDGLVHRVTISRELIHQVHDEMMHELEPWTGCGIPLAALGKEAGDVPERVGFRSEGEPLTCVSCASGRQGFGDIHRQVRKALMFSSMYGGKSYNMKQVVGRMSGKASNLRQMVKYQQFTNQIVRNYAKADAENTMALGNALHSAYERMHRRRFSCNFIHQLATAVLPPEK